MLLARKKEKYKDELNLPSRQLMNRLAIFGEGITIKEELLNHFYQIKLLKEVTQIVMLILLLDDSVCLL